MQDPLKENIQGAKATTHHVEHRVDWGHVALGVGGLALAYVIWRAVQSSSEREDGEDLIAT